MLTLRCPAKFGGLRCELVLTGPSSERPSAGSSAETGSGPDAGKHESSRTSVGVHVYVVAVVVALVVICAVVVAVCCAIKRRQQRYTIVKYLIYLLSLYDS